MMSKLFYICLVLFGVHFASRAILEQEWVTLDFDWETPEQKEGFIAANNILTGIKLWKNRTFVAVPRWRRGVPSTLNEVVMKDGKAILKPYPSWQMQNVEDPSAFQYIQSFEIDSRGWIWILDVGRRNILDDDDVVVNGPAKLVIWDIMKNCSVKTHVFPNHVLEWDSSFANDVVVDQARGYAYISNTWGKGGIIVYSFNENESWRFNHESLGGDPNNVVTINGVAYGNIVSPSDGIAISRDTRTLYYCSISKRTMYSIPTFALMDKYMPNEEVGKYVRAIGEKHGFADGLTTDINDVLYYGDFEGSALYAWKTGSALSSAVLLADNMRWVDTFAWTDNYLYYTTNKLELFLAKTMVFDGSDGSNFQIWKIRTNSSSYLTNSKPMPTSLPCQR